MKKHKTLHERFLARRKQQPENRDSLLAKQERERAEQALREAASLLWEAKAKCDAALLYHHGWSFDSLRWQHSPSDSALYIATPHYWLRVPNMNPLLFESIEEALECWFLATTNLGRYPERPKASLYERLQKGLGGIQKVVDE